MIWRIWISVYLFIIIYFTNEGIEVSAGFQGDSLYDQIQRNLTDAHERLKEEINNLTKELQVGDIRGSSNKYIYNRLLTSTLITLFSLIILN
ncbi:unnamed protein product [Schistosoma rodhaini]|uniref:Uncharacterized protein n=1 Tax=Schistosoma rodhaini TaxID=6188 RepID=A0AA85GF35_9TREM|nr:unnamed protein product [Schistosoma rodhaini]